MHKRKPAVVHSILTDVLTTKLKEQSIEIPPATISLLCEYITLLHEWDQVYRLTGVADPLVMLERHVIDSLSLLNYLDPNVRVADVGSGAGLPGIPLACVRREQKFVLIEVRQRAGAFLHFACAKLGLNNVEIVGMRVESYTTRELFGVVMARAVASVRKIMQLTKHLLAPDGVWLLMQGPQAPNQGLPGKMFSLPANCGAERNLLIVRKEDE